MIDYVKRALRMPVRMALLALAAILAVSGSTVSPVYADVDVPDRIRVALLLSYPARSFNVTSPVVTLQAGAGMKLVWRGPDKSLPLADIAAGAPVRFALDGYRAVLLETTDYSAATAALAKVKASSKAGLLTRLQKYGKTVFQLSEGAYAKQADALAALSRFSGQTSGASSLSAARVAGPWAVQSGPYGSREEASAAAAAFGAAGLDAFVAVKPSSGAIAYFAYVGGEADRASAEALVPAVGAAGGIDVRVPASGEPYALLRADVSASGSADKPSTLYAIPASASAVLRADPLGDGGIAVTEKSGRKYRGSLEIGELNGALSLVNDVRFDEYLYSVVGAEVGSGWPAEAQKAQAVAARSYALSQGNRFQIASVVDSTLSQAYNGIGSENANSTAGVNATSGEVLTSGGRIIEAVFGSNAGGVTADNLTEGWGSDIAYLTGGATSPDEGPNKGKLDWTYVALESGKTGYIRSDLLVDAGRNDAGVAVLRVAGNGTQMRPRPLVQSDVQPLGSLDAGTIVVPLRTVPEYSAYSWAEPPFTAEQLQASLAKAKLGVPSTLQTLEVSKRGPSGRITEIKVNGQPFSLKVADGWRSALGGLRSTLADIEETGRYAIAGAGGATRQLPQEAGAVTIAGAGGAVSTSSAASGMFVMDGSGTVRVVTEKPTFVMTGRGYGHGIGMSQWGARGLAEQGYDYKAILLHYYKNVKIEKDAGG